MAACTPPPATVPAPTATPVSTPTPPPTLAPTATPETLTAERLRQAEYHLLQSERIVQLANGQFEAGAGAEYVSVRVLDQLALGDLNGDGAPDAAVLLAENYGGTGTFVALVAVLDQGGQLVQADAVLIDDRPMVQTLTVDAGRITVAALIHGLNDPFCCPAWPVRQTYELRQGRLTLVQLTSQTPDGQTRAIQIDTPTAGATAAATVTVQGRVTVAPFENNLTYRLLDAQGGLISQGPVPVQAETLGGPGSFAAQIDLAAGPANSPFRLEIVDVSAADGSALALASVDLIVK